jgi:NitT/TauT family transport system substrate-binding protein
MIRYLLMAALALAPALSAAEPATVRVGIQPGLTYLALNVMNHEKLLEKRAKDAGADLTVEWIVSANGTVLNDGVLSGNIDIAGTGIPAFVTIWSKGRGSVDARGIAAYGSLPGKLVSLNPNVHAFTDFSDADRIAVPAPRASIQAILLDMMAEKTWGPGHAERIDRLMVGLSHPDGMLAMLAGNAGVNAHFSSSPFYDEELKRPGAHVVLDKSDIFPGPLTHGMLWTTRKFHDGNPETMRRFREALEDAMTIIHTDPERAARAYLALAKEKIDPAQAVILIKTLNAHFETTPRGVFPVASFMFRSGMIKTAPKDWKDLFFEEEWTADGS